MKMKKKHLVSGLVLNIEVFNLQIKTYLIRRRQCKSEDLDSTSDLDI